MVKTEAPPPPMGPDGKPMKVINSWNADAPMDGKTAVANAKHGEKAGVMPEISDRLTGHAASILGNRNNNKGPHR